MIYSESRSGNKLLEFRMSVLWIRADQAPGHCHILYLYSKYCSHTSYSLTRCWTVTLKLIPDSPRRSWASAPPRWASRPAGPSPCPPPATAGPPPAAAGPAPQYNRRSCTTAQPTLPTVLTFKHKLRIRIILSDPETTIDLRRKSSQRFFCWCMNFFKFKLFSVKVKF